MQLNRSLTIRTSPFEHHQQLALAELVRSSGPMSQNLVRTGSQPSFVPVDWPDYPIPHSHIIRSKYFFTYFISTSAVFVGIRAVRQPSEQYWVASFVFHPLKVSVCFNLQVQGSGILN